MKETESTEIAQYLTFKLEDEIFAIDIGDVREVLDFTTVTQIPQAPEFMIGVINLRGNVVPVLDMRLKLGMTATPQMVNTCIIITEIKVEGELMVLGAMADSVQEVIDLGRGEIEPMPRLGTKLNTEFFRGVGKHDDKFMIILDIDKVFSFGELAPVEQLGENALQ